MADPRMQPGMSPMPFDGQRMIYGGFRPSSTSEGERCKGSSPSLVRRDAEAAVARYVDLVPGSAVGAIVRYPEAGREIHGRIPGSAMTVDFRLGDTGSRAERRPVFTFTPAVSLFVSLEHAAAVDRLWEGLIEGGTALMPLDRYDWSEHYGWLSDRWGLTGRSPSGSTPTRSHRRPRR